MKRYRVYSSHCGDPPTHEYWNCKTDAEALEKFRKICQHPDKAWDDLRIEGIDVEEQTTTLAYGHADGVNIINQS